MDQQSMSLSTCHHDSCFLFAPGINKGLAAKM
ncbi:hypothetical protein CORC01_10085 [Colletotrichum orchidophilum]|uniref:Uncharacterized protein n=1 Tax=Colletotrichum orchidophilum TaxID=1209926 RepID=A0A1G4AZI8_9PEZI|nr:uncharacterized protein CORC01_10085 [Colletotrichum orchidophilum]OHE94557.1 hypothetical protein CORC01_10085 [Colletotrichum orchidophilum]